VKRYCILELAELALTFKKGAIMVTIEDVAKKVQKSMMTVFRVINNQSVSDKTRRDTWKVIEQMGYILNLEGSRLASLKKPFARRTGNIGSITFSTYNKSSEPFFAEIMFIIIPKLRPQSEKCLTI